MEDFNMDMEWNYDAYMDFLKDSVSENVEDIQHASGLMHEALHKKNKELKGYIEALCARDCPEEYKNVIYKEVFKKERK